MKTYNIMMAKERKVCKVKAHNIAEAVSKFRFSHKDVSKGWNILDRTHSPEHNSWSFERHSLKTSLKKLDVSDMMEDGIADNWIGHVDTTGLF